MDGMKTRQRIVTIGVVVLILLVIVVNGTAIGRRVRSSVHNEDVPKTVKADDKNDPSQKITDQATSKPAKKNTEKSTEKTTESNDREKENNSSDKELVMTVIDPDKPLIAFTFDDGPYSPVTDRIVAAFEKAGGNCTFFNVGERWEDGYTDYIRSGRNAVEKGNEIGSHSYHHTDLTTLSKASIKKQIEKSCGLIEKNTGRKVELLRPPFGAVNDLVSDTVAKPMILWSLDSQDWKSRNADAIYKRVVKEVQDGSVILMHDLYDTTAEAVERLLPRLQKKGYQFVTVSELFEYRDVKLKDGQVYGSNAVKNPDSTATQSSSGGDAAGNEAPEDYINYEDDQEDSEM